MSISRGKSVICAIHRCSRSMRRSTAPVPTAPAPTASGHSSSASAHAAAVQPVDGGQADNKSVVPFPFSVPVPGSVLVHWPVRHRVPERGPASRCWCRCGCRCRYRQTVWSRWISLRRTTSGRINSQGTSRVRNAGRCFESLCDASALFVALILANDNKCRCEPISADVAPVG